MNVAAPLLVIDGDPGFLKAAEHALRGLGTLDFACCVEEAITALQCGDPYAVVVTSLSLPEAQASRIFASSRDQNPHSVHVVLVAHESPRCISQAVNQARVFRVLARPFSGAQLRQAVTEAQEEYARITRDHISRELVTRDRDTLQGSLHGSLEAIAAMLSVVHPAAFGRATRLRRMSTLLAERVGLTDSWEIQMAALLSQFGLLSLPAELVDRLIRNLAITAAEKQLLRASTEAALHVMHGIPEMDRVCQILRSVDLVPSFDALPATEACDAQRILTIVMDFDTFFAEHGSAGEALRVMDSHIGRYHAPWLDALHEIVGSPNAAMIIDVSLADVRPGQIFAADVRSPRDLLLVARGQPVTPPLLLKIRNDWSSFAGLTMVRVVQPAACAPDTVGAEPEGQSSHRAA